MTTRRISPSQIATFQLCERRWYFAKVLGIPEPDTGRAESGKGMHWLLKEWFINKEPPRVRRPPPGEGKVGPTEVGMALASLGALPPPSEHLIVEEHIQVEYGGIVYHGYADLIWHTAAKYAIVHDHKSTSSLQWAKDEAELEFDAQRIFYSYSTGVDTLARWQYVETESPHDRKLVEVFGTRPQIVHGMQWLHETYGQRMLAAFNEPEEARPQNPAACGKFGKAGCPYKHRCQISGPQRIKQIMSIEAIKARMRERQKTMNVSEPAPPPSEPVPPPEVVEDPANDTTPGPAAAATPGEEAAPKARARRSDAGKPRKPRTPKDTPAEQPNAPAQPPEESEDEKATRGELGYARASEVTIDPNGPEQALLQVIAVVRALPQRQQIRVLNAARAFIVEGS